MSGIERILVISTGHVSEDTADWLDSIDWFSEGPSGNKYGEYGWFMYAHDDPACIPSPPHAPAGQYPTDLWAVFEKARELGAFYVLLDCDAIKINGLKTWEW